MKAKKEHRVPLSNRAAELLRTQLKINHSDFAFPAPKDRMLSDMTLTAALRRLEVDAVHTDSAQPSEIGVQSGRSIQTRSTRIGIEPAT